MTISSQELCQILMELATLIEKNADPSFDDYINFINEPELSFQIVALLDALDESEIEEKRGYYSACIFALEICVAEMQAACESGQKIAQKSLLKLMQTFAEIIDKSQHTLTFWLPVLNAFYDAHVELSDELKQSYMMLAENNDDMTFEDDESHLESIRGLIKEMSDLSVFDIAENFFAQSYAMPPEFFADLIMDLYSIEEGKDIAILMLMHPKQDVRAVALAVFDQIIDSITLNPISLSRLQAMVPWHAVEYQEKLNRWIFQQRKKGVVFHREKSEFVANIKATEIDGSGAQGIFIHLKKQRKNRLVGVLLKQHVGIKDAWVTPMISAQEIDEYYHEVFDDSVMLRDVTMEYLSQITNHFLATTVAKGGMPALHLLEIQEALGVHFLPAPLDISALLNELAITISPFTEEIIVESMKRSKSWPKNKRFTESWYAENTHIDKLVNGCCSFIDSVKVCRFEDAYKMVFSDELETHRDDWLFHFLWVALWLRAKTRKNAKEWQDSFIIAYLINAGASLDSIPIMHEICHQSVMNSMETMHERRTHLS